MRFFLILLAIGATALSLSTDSALNPMHVYHCSVQKDSCTKYLYTQLKKPWARKSLMKQCHHGDPKACHILGQLRSKKKPKQSAILYDRACRLGNPASCEKAQKLWLRFADFEPEGQSRFLMKAFWIASRGCAYKIQSLCNDYNLLWKNQKVRTALWEKQCQDKKQESCAELKAQRQASHKLQGLRPQYFSLQQEGYKEVKCSVRVSEHPSKPFSPKRKLSSLDQKIIVYTDLKNHPASFQVLSDPSAPVSSTSLNQLEQQLPLLLEHAFFHPVPKQAMAVSQQGDWLQVQNHESPKNFSSLAIDTQNKTFIDYSKKLQTSYKQSNHLHYPEYVFHQERLKDPELKVEWQKVSQLDHSWPKSLQTKSKSFLFQNCVAQKDSEQKSFSIAP